jgi:hypothetical protein
MNTALIAGVAGSLVGIIAITAVVIKLKSAAAVGTMGIKDAS